MDLLKPVCCMAEAFDLMVSTVRTIDGPDSLVRGSMAIAMQGLGSADVEGADRVLQHYADTVRARSRTRHPQSLLAHLHELLFEEEGFGGNDQDYYDVRNSFLPEVLRTRRGLPITLAVIYRDVARRAGICCWGVNIPGHFVVAVQDSRAAMLIDVFCGGRVIDPLEAQARFHQTFGEHVAWTDEFLRPASHRAWLTRMLQNLLHSYSSANRYMDMAAVLEMEMVLWPDETRLQRDLALVLARCGLSQPARMWLEGYLKDNPNDPQDKDLRRLLAVLTV
jgi:regulator of sirC expression with transglutaminase-like and TPR domain